jgi:hypothetical protein
VEYTAIKRLECSSCAIGTVDVDAETGRLPPVLVASFVPCVIALAFPLTGVPLRRTGYRALTCACSRGVSIARRLRIITHATLTSADVQPPEAEVISLSCADSMYSHVDQGVVLTLLLQQVQQGEVLSGTVAHVLPLCRPLQRCSGPRLYRARKLCKV